VIKYLGSKRALVPVLGAIASAVRDAVGATSALDLFTGTTRVAQELKRRGLHVTAADTASYSRVLADCYIGTDGAQVPQAEVRDALDRLNALPGHRGYVTEVFCEKSRYFQPKNGMRIDAVRDAIERDYAGSWLYPILLTALMLAADRVDSTTGVQMAYLKQWAPRAYNDLELRVPALLVGPGLAVLGEAADVVDEVGDVDLAYLDPPYNQHSYRANYHVWETLIRWDDPPHYGVACKRADIRDPGAKSPFNRRRDMPSALRRIIERVRARTLVVSYNDESWVDPDDILRWLSAGAREVVRVLAFDSKRYVGAQIGIHDPSGRKVGQVSHVRNIEYLFIAGPADAVEAAGNAVPAPAGGQALPRHSGSPALTKTGRAGRW
jgi:adenine-specific DNA-methyltransferase